MKPKVLYREIRAANVIERFSDKLSWPTIDDEYRYSLDVSVTRYAPDVVILDIKAYNPDSNTDEHIRNLLPAWIYDFAAIREGIKAFDTALGQFEPDEG